jgi:hypothetical protein
MDFNVSESGMTACFAPVTKTKKAKGNRGIGDSPTAETLDAELAGKNINV